MIEIKPYGSWNSKLSAEKLAEKGVRFGHLCVDGEDVYWLESRAKESGRNVLVKCDGRGHRSEPLPDSVSVRSKVHEYGSGDFLVDNGIVFFSNGADQCVYKFDPNLDNAQIELVTLPNPNGEDRYADYSLSPDGRFLVCVRERHAGKEVLNELISIDLLQSGNDKTVPRVIHSGYDFYSFPRFSPQGHRLCWTCWNQPDMPWDAAELWLADFHSDGSTDANHKVTGGLNQPDGDSKSAIYQPSWSPDGVLHYISDSSGWTNLYSQRGGVLNALTPIDREFGIPQWSLASSTYATTSTTEIYAIYLQNGIQTLCHINVDSGHIEPIDLPFESFGEHLVYSNGQLYFIGASRSMSEAVYRYDISENKLSCLNEKTEFPLDSLEISPAEPIEFPSKNNRLSYGFYYRPNNSKYDAPEKTFPPLIVMSHGGPTGMTNPSLNSGIQFWTNRGFAVVDVNYGGSTGYGNKYRNSLKGNWGIVDVEDCIAAALYLAEQGKADREKLLIRGGSAGGYTTLCALTFHDIFAAGCSRYGVADLESLASDSHKFEARYLDSVVGPYPEMKATYQARSPIHHTDQLSCPILLLQGEDDKVVPPNQAEMMVEALEKNDLPYVYRLYKGEAHGFRKAETIIDALESELSFYQQILVIENESGKV